MIFAVLACVCAIALGGPVNHAFHDDVSSSLSTSPIPILKQFQDGPHPDGSYSYSYETGNGISAEEQGQLKTFGPESAAVVVQGAFRYKNDDGSDVALTYVADENGFQPQGAHLPIAPPIPEAIQRALEWIAAHPPKPEESQPGASNSRF